MIPGFESLGGAGGFSLSSSATSGDIGPTSVNVGSFNVPAYPFGMNQNVMLAGALLLGAVLLVNRKKGRK